MNNDNVVNSELRISEDENLEKVIAAEMEVTLPSQEDIEEILANSELKGN